MKNQLTEDELWDLVGFIKISPLRLQTMQALKSEYMMPSEIARMTGMRTTQASNALISLKDKNLVICMNETAYKGRLYQTTELGDRVLEFLEKKKTRY